MRTAAANSGLFVVTLVGAGAFFVGMVVARWLSS
jgi:hypothetical protein